MALPSYTISSSIVNVDCSGSGKIIFLPPANTIQGVPIWIRDSAGTCSQVNSIFISTQGSDRMDRFASTLRLSTAYQSVRCVAWQPTHYAILQNYTYGLQPFLAQFTQGISWNLYESVRTWSAVCSSTSGSVMSAVVGGGGGQIYVSTTSGTTWTAYGPTLIWTGIACSSDGTKMVAVSNGDRIYTSTNTGVNWTPRDSPKSWSCVCSSSNGSVLLAGTSSDFLYLSTNSGVSWTAVNISTTYTFVACSSNGVIQYAVTSGGQIYVSTDTGSTWTARDSARSWTGVACSSDGSIAFATEGTYIYKTTDTGVTWTPNTSYPGAWRCITCSSSAQYVLAVDSTTGFINLSGTTGVDFILSGDPASYQAIAINQLGVQAIAAASPGRLYVGALQLL